VDEVEGDSSLKIDFPYWSANRAGPNGKILLNTLNEYNFEQLVDFATHDKGNILDLVITNCASRILSVSENGKLGNSDLCIIETIIDVSRSDQAPARTIVSWDKADYTEMYNELGSVDWAMELNGQNIDEKLQKLKNIIESSMTRHVPVRVCRNSAKPRWLSRDLVKLVRKKKRAWKEYKLARTAETLGRYNSIEKELKRKIRKAKRRLERELTMKDDRNGKKFTNYIKSKTKVKTGIGLLKGEDGNPTANDNEMAEILNKAFTSVFT
jgi:hypothetical protein